MQGKTKQKLQQRKIKYHVSRRTKEGEGEDSCTNYKRGKERRKEDEQQNCAGKYGNICTTSVPRNKPNQL